MSDQPCVSINDLQFAWRPGDLVLDVSSLQINRGEKLFLQGASGSGKSTLLGLIAGVYEQTAGEVVVCGHTLGEMGANARDALRADAMGVIFQQFNLVPYLSLVENVLLPCQFAAARARRAGADRSARRRNAHDLLHRLGLGKEAREDRPVAELSVGQQQRVAAARALIGEPSLIIADEPTSALDDELRDAFIEMLIEEAKNASVLFVSHDVSLAARFDRAIAMQDINAADSKKARVA